MNGPINKGVSSALARVFFRRSAILKIVEEKALGTRLFLDFFYRTALITVVFFNCHVFVEKKIRHVSVLNFIDG